MVDPSIRPAFGRWAHANGRLRDTVAGLADAQLAIQPSPERWPLWATIGHLACQRVFWLCDVAREPGAETTRFTNAAFDCPGDDDLETVLTTGELVEAIDATFRIVERCLDTWTLPMLTEEIRHPEWPGDQGHTRGFVIERVFSHDIWHIAELNETLGRAELPLIDIWD